MSILLAILLIIAIPIVVCLSLKKSRKAYIESIRELALESKSMVDDEIICPFIEKPMKIKAVLLTPLALLFILFAIAIFIFLTVIIAPTGLIIKKDDEKDSAKRQARLAVKEEPKFIFQRDSVRYKVALENLSFDPSPEEVIYYNPSSNELYDHIIRDNLDKLTEAFSSRNKRFIYLPGFNDDLTQDNFKAQVEYEIPGHIADNQTTSVVFSYSDIKGAYHIPDDVNEPCLVRCMSTDLEKRIQSLKSQRDPSEISSDIPSLSFSIHFLKSNDADSFMSEIKTYLSLLSRGPLFNLSSVKDDESNDGEKTADDRFDDDIYKISEEIRERVNQLKARGLTSLAITKLIGDIDDNPSRLVIDRHNKIILPDYNNKEIKLSPIHKAVFFLFLNHPEGIYFKDLPSYKEELGRIYGSITGREDLEAIDESIEKLTDPFDNSINEKCARIKNAFVSEFREDLAKWYFIDGRKGEKKTIKLPRDLVTWEIKD